MEYRYGVNTCRFSVFYHKKSLFFIVGGFFCLMNVRSPLDVGFCSVSRTVKEPGTSIAPLHSLHLFLVSSGLLFVASCEAWCFRLSISAFSCHSLSLLLDVECMAKDNVQKMKRWKPISKRPIWRPKTRWEDMKSTIVRNWNNWHEDSRWRT